MAESSSGIASDRDGIQIVNLALAEGLISQEQWGEALAVQSKEFSSGRWVRPLTSILLSLGHIGQDELNVLRGRVRACWRDYNGPGSSCQS